MLNEFTRADTQVLSSGDLGLKLEISRNQDELRGVWQDLETRAGGSVFQSWEWCRSWSGCAAQTLGETCVVIVGRDEGGIVRLVLPFGMRVRAGVRQLGWFGQSHSNYGLGVIDPAIVDRLTPDAAATLLNTIGNELKVDLIHLAGQPQDWGGRLNPFARLAGVSDANDTYWIELEPDFASQRARLFSSRKRSQLKRKEKKLFQGERGAYVRAGTAAQKQQFLDVFFEQKRSQLDDMGADNAFASAEIKQHYRTLITDTGPQSGLILDAVVVDDYPVAVALQMRQQNGQQTCMYLLNSSIAPGQHSASSPGALLLHHCIDLAHAAGATRYDLGPGTLPYKLEWQPTTVPLINSVLPLTIKGLAAASCMTPAIMGKRLLKRSKHLRPLAQAMRRSFSTGGSQTALTGAGTGSGPT